MKLLRLFPEKESPVKKSLFFEKVPVTPELLKWARFYSGKMSSSEVASSVSLKSLTSERIIALEHGEDEPTLSELLELVNFYNRPFALFFLPKPPSDIPDMVDHRTMKTGEVRIVSKKLELAYWRAYELRNVITELSKELDEPVVDVLRAPKQVKDSPEDLARWARETLGIKKLFANHRTNPEDILEKWISTLENFGIVVVQLTFDPVDSRAFSLGAKNPPIIVLSYTDKDRARLFSLFHEFAHITLRQSAICDMSSESTWAEELFCNRFAASFLMPQQEVKEIVDKFGGYGLDAVADAISARSGVSIESAFLRLVDLGYASRDGYLERKSGYEEAYKQWLERHRRGGGPNLNPAGTAYRKYGKHVSSLAYRGFREGVITRAEASAIMRLPARELPKLSREFKE